MRTLSIRFALLTSLTLATSAAVIAQDRIVTVPKSVPGAPFRVEDTEDLFGKAYRWFKEGEVEWATDSLRKLVSLTGFELSGRDYHTSRCQFQRWHEPDWYVP